MRALKALTVVMGVMIVAGVVLLAVLMTRRLSTPVGPAAALTLDEPAGSRITGIASQPDGLAVLLSGGGPDRVVVLDPRSGRVAARIVLAR